MSFASHLKDANEGDSYAQSWIGHAYEEGLGVKMDLKKALHWHKKAAKNGEAYSQCWLAWAFEHGELVRKSNRKSFLWTKRAALQGYPHAEYNMGQSYAEAFGVSQNLKLAVKWWSRAAKQGHIFAQCNLGKAYEGGEGVRKNLPKAKKLYESSAKHGDSISKFNLARLKAKAGFFKAAQTAFKSVVPELKKLARRKDTSAMICLSDCAYKGWGMRLSKQEAVKWYRLAAKEGYLNGFLGLGYCYQDGDGVRKDAKKAKYYFSMASRMKKARK
jgi:hypothetical protein